MRIPRRFLIGADGEPRLWWHWQNLDTEHIGRTERRTGSGWSHGRAWLHAGRSSAEVSWLFSLRRHHVGAQLELGGYDDNLTLHAGVPCASLWLSIDAPWIFRLCHRFGPRELAVKFHGGSVWWTLWVDDSERRYPRSFADRVRAGSFDPVAFLLGRPVYTSTDLEQREIDVPLPERSYRGTARLHDDAWRRPRWPFPLRIRRVSIEMHDGEQLPHPGKGENSWDGGEDATFGITTAAATIEDGIGHLVASVLRSRLRHGGPSWRPAAGAPAR